MATSPPPPIRPPRWRRLYAHVISLEAGCPRCGCLTVSSKGKHNRAYTRANGIYCCPGCGARWYVGVVFWPIPKGKNLSGKAEDHTLTPGEAARLREVLNSETGDSLNTEGARVNNRRRAQINYACTCGVGCPVHAPELLRGDDDAGDD